MFCLSPPLKHCPPPPSSRLERASWQCPWSRCKPSGENIQNVCHVCRGCFGDPSGCSDLWYFGFTVPQVSALLNVLYKYIPGASPPWFQFGAVLPASLQHVSRRARRIAIAMPVFQREGRSAVSVASPLASLGLDLQTDRRRKARVTAAEKYRSLHQKGTQRKLNFPLFFLLI
jgi:hypothetical protein